MLGYVDREHTVAVMFGGRSSEHEISLRSAVYFLKNTPPQYKVILVGISKEGLMFSPEGVFSHQEFENITENDLAKIANGEECEPLRAAVVPSIILPQPTSTLSEVSDFPSRVLNYEAEIFAPILHGENGEDGRIQSLLELAELAYIGCNARTSAIGMDKRICKNLAEQWGVPVVESVHTGTEEWAQEPASIVEKVEKSFGYPCFVKPNAMGSAIGVNRATNRDELAAAITHALSLDLQVLVEREIENGLETELAFMGTPYQSSITVPGAIKTEDFYDYETKYGADSTAKLSIPTDLPDKKIQEVRQYANKIAQALNLEGLCRIDFWYEEETQKFYFNEVNTMPGLTSISMFPKLMEYSGIHPKTWIHQLLQDARQRLKEQQKLELNTVKAS